MTTPPRSSEGGSHSRFDELQLTLHSALDANQPGSGIEHAVIAIASYSVGESLLSHYADRLPALEHRYLVAMLILGRIANCRLAFVSCQAPEQAVVDYYTSLMPPAQRDSVSKRLLLITVPDPRPRPIAAKLLDREDLLDSLQSFIGSAPSFIEAWNVTADEVAVAERLGVPINGTAPALRTMAFKSAGRRLFARAGVPTPLGHEDVHTVDEVVTAIEDIRAKSPGARGVVVKHDDSGAGDGNVVLDLVSPATSDNLRARIQALPAWYLNDLSRGGVVEELITGEWFSSPSAQVDMEPSGDVVVRATHEQILGGESGQVYMGCRFPADAAYASEIGRYAKSVGETLRQQGAIGRAAIDFAAARTASGAWAVSALEVNLRKGGTTHPYAVLRNLVPGRYDVEAARWIAADGTERAYVSTDNAVNPRWRGRAASSVISALAGAGVEFDPRRGTGVVLHMLSGLAIDGRFGLTAIGRSPEEADALFQRALRAAAA